MNAESDARNMNLSARAAVMLEAKQLNCLYQRRALCKYPCASTTKIATALLVLDNAKLDSSVVISSQAINTPYSMLREVKSKTLTVSDLLHLLILSSDNGAAIALAQHVAGSEALFVKLLNERVKSIGCKATLFKNPHGLPSLGHVSTAFDLSLIERQAMQNAAYREIVSKSSYSIDRGNRSHFRVENKNPFQRTPGFDCVKTGWTNEAGYCLVAAYHTRSTRYIMVVLGCPTRKDSIKDLQTLATLLN